MAEDGQKMPIKVLVLGFSVVADTPGFVEQAQVLASTRFDIAKVGIGGINLRTFRYMLPLLLAQNPCDLLVLEIGTSGLRWNTPEQTHEYGGLVGKVVAELHKHGHVVAFWDLPRANCATGPDTVYDTHAALAAAAAMPYRRTPFMSEMLRDGVHASAEGHRFYARELVSFLDDIVESDALKRQFPQQSDPSTTFSHTALPMSSVWPRSDIVLERLTRSGLDIDLVELKSEASVTLTVPEPWQIRGFSYLIGPKCGAFSVSLLDGSQTRKIRIYDEFSYYRHMGLKLFPFAPGSSVVLTQLEHPPNVQLLKGEPDTGPRCGFLGHLLVSRNEESA